MSDTALQRTLKVFMKKKGLTVAAMEKAAGLKLNGIRNILHGQSKNPTASTLQALANFMGCSIQDLLDDRWGPLPITPPRAADAPLAHPDLLQEALATIFTLCEERAMTLSLSQLIPLLVKVYHYGLQKDPPTIDKDFAAWSLNEL